MARAPYRDPEYRAASDDLKAHPRLCATPRCHAVASTLDHVPPLGLHHHVRGSGCCVLVGKCVRCNLGAGARIAAARRTRRTRPRPGASRRW
jgi:hypothetical protein